MWLLFINGLGISGRVPIIVARLSPGCQEVVSSSGQLGCIFPSRKNVHSLQNGNGNGKGRKRQLMKMEINLPNTRRKCFSYGNGNANGMGGKVHWPPNCSPHPNMPINTPVVALLRPTCRPPWPRPQYAHLSDTFSFVRYVFSCLFFF